MEPRNVMLMTRTLGHGGTERQLTETALALDPAAFTPHVACVESTGFRADELRRRGIPILELPITSLKDPRSLRALARFLRYMRQHSIRLLHSFDTSTNTFGIPLAKLPGGPVALSSQRCFENVVWPPNRKLNRIAHRLADGIVVNCEAVERHLREDYGLPAEKIHVCRNGLDTSVFRPRETGYEKPEALRDAELVIGSVSVLRAVKSLPTLVSAFALIKDTRPGLKLAIVGSGPVREELESQAREYGIADRCVFHPATHDVAAWLRAIDVFVLPSISEAFSNSLMEAMACGCAAVASNVGGNPELVRHGETGLLFTPGDAQDLARQLTVMVSSEEQRNRMAETGSAWVAKNLSREAAAQCMETIYRQYLNEPRR
ncbi:MAG TPA: glycosyltransferase [Bryobacteraceae bacterium]|nr:glycosyltransferase [Bryobacteraceae bacterium]